LPWISLNIQTFNISVLSKRLVDGRPNYFMDLKEKIKVSPKEAKLKN
jgi:hypothetical protein